MSLRHRVSLTQLPPPPLQGMIEYKDVWMRYRPELEPVLQGELPHKREQPAACLS